MKLPKVTLSPAIKKNLPTAAFVLMIPLGIVIGYFFSNIKDFVSGGYKGVFMPLNKMLYVAKIDGIGIPKKEWEDMLKSRYGTTVASNLIDIYLIKNELKKAGINVTDTEIDAAIAKIEAQLGGQSLEELLKQQGGTLADLRKDVSLQVGMEKLLSNKISVTDEEVTAYIEAAGDTLEGSTDDEKKAAAQQILKDQKLSEAINAWFVDVQSKAKIENYLQ